MKKIFFLTLLATFAVIGKSHAQDHLVATLDHEGTLSTFTGSNAFVQAHAAAAHGDIITLSSGMFAAPDTLSKAITLYGTGIISDSTSAQTIINSVMKIKIPDGVSQILTIEGIYFTNNLSYVYVNNPVFNKCRMYGFSYYGNTNCKIYNAKFNQCRILSCYITPSSSATFNNCFLSYDAANVFGECFFYNSVISSPLSCFGGSSFINCFLYGTGSSVLPSSSNAISCVGYKTSGEFIFKNVIDNSTDVLVDSLGAVFKTWRGNYDDHETFELTDEAKTKYLGNDGTQIGIYGGAMPYDPTPTNPQITKFLLTPKPAEKKLEIQIEAK